MTIQEIYNTLKACKEQNDEIPIGVLADMLEEANCDPDKVQHLRGEGVEYEFSLFYDVEAWTDFDWCPVHGPYTEKQAMLMTKGKVEFLNLLFWMGEKLSLVVMLCRPAKKK